MTKKESRRKRGNSRVIVNLMTRGERERCRQKTALKDEQRGKGLEENKGKKDSRDREKTEEDKVKEMCTNKVELSE